MSICEACRLAACGEIYAPNVIIGVVVRHMRNECGGGIELPGVGGRAVLTMLSTG